MLQNMAKIPDYFCRMSALVTTSNNEHVSKGISPISSCIKQKSYKITS